MNIFVLDTDPKIAAMSQCDKHVVKMTTELYQQLGSALRRHGASDQLMPLTKSGSPLRGAYPNHPCTKWCGDSIENFRWACDHALALAQEYTYRYGKVHFCENAIRQMIVMDYMIPKGDLTPFAQAMPPEYRNDDAVAAYRGYYIKDKMVNIQMKWTKRKVPWWLNG